MDKLSSDDAFELGNQFRDAAIALGDWRIKNRASLSKAEWQELDDREITLLNTASSIFTSAIGLILADTQVALPRVQFSIKSAKSAIKRITGFKQALDLASALGPSSRCCLFRQRGDNSRRNSRAGRRG